MKFDINTQEAIFSLEELDSLMCNYAHEGLLPRKPGIYMFISNDDNEAWYVGASSDVYQRCQSHRSNEGVISKIVGDYRVAYLYVGRRNALADIEMAFIRRLKPKLNKRSCRNVTGSSFESVLHES